jgi:uncharacterized membrane protein YcaP (DUF421 family)
MPDLGSGPIEVAIRTAVVYLFLVLVLRLAGRREVGQMSILDLVVILLIANGAQNAMVGENTTLVGGMISAATLVLLDRGLDAVLRRNQRLSHLLEGEPILLISGGRALPKAMRRAHITQEELERAVRAHGLAAVSDVSLAVLEADGSVSVIPRDGSR